MGEIEKYRGISVPQRAGVLERMLVSRVRTEKLHPNPDDEFSMPGIGPNFEIISNYGRQIRKARDQALKDPFDEPISVEKMSPDGYMILNGHHRWAACLNNGVAKIRVEIVNTTHEADLRAMLQKTDNRRRVTMDLDEVVFAAEGETAVERKRWLTLRPLERRPIRLGIPALFRFFTANGYDIWVYTKRYESFDDVQHCFFMRRARVTGVVTGTEKKTGGESSSGDKAENLIAGKYDMTLHIDRDLLLQTSRTDGTFREYPLTAAAEGWSREIMDIVQGMKV